MNSEKVERVSSLAVISLMVLLLFLGLVQLASSQWYPLYDENLTNDQAPYQNSPSWCSDGEKIYYQYKINWHRHIWVMDNDGSNKTQLTSGSVVDEDPNINPNCTKIVFKRWGFRGDYHDLMIMNPDGTSQTRLTFSGLPGKNEGSYEAPSWSEDGTKIICHYSDGPTGGSQTCHCICVVYLNGTVVDLNLRGEHPILCFNDTRILFNTDSFINGNTRIHMVDYDQATHAWSNFQNLTQGTSDFFPAISPITRRILFIRNTNLYVMNSDGGNLLRITNNGTVGSSDWSPDEEYIAYACDKSGSEDVWKMSAPPHSIAIINVTVCHDATTVHGGQTCCINVTVTNNGDFTESFFDVSVYWNDTHHIQTIQFTLAPGETNSTCFSWDTTGLTEYKNYNITAYAHPVPGEADLGDNTKYTIVKIVHDGDVNADKVVDISDLYAIALGYGKNAGEPGYEPELDENCDGTIDISDLYACALQYGWHP